MRTLNLATIATFCLFVATGCSSAFYQSGGQSAAYNDLYGVQQPKLKVQPQAKPQQVTQSVVGDDWDAIIAQANTYDNLNDYYNAQEPDYQNVLADDYQTAAARRTAGRESGSYHSPSSVATAQFSRAFDYASAYDPAFYNIVISGDQVWAEPKYVTSMFGSWGDVTIVYNDPWYNGWSSPVYGWGSRYYGWGRYNPYYGWGGYYPRPGWGGYYPYPGWGGYYPYPGWGGYYPHPGYYPYPGGHYPAYRPHRPTPSYRRNDIVHRASSSSPSGSYRTGTSSSSRYDKRKNNYERNTTFERKDNDRNNDPFDRNNSTRNENNNNSFDRNNNRGSSNINRGGSSSSSFSRGGGGGSSISRPVGGGGGFRNRGGR